MPQTKPVISVENVVASASVDQKIDLIEVTKKHPKTEYHPEQFPGLVFRLENPRTATLIFRTGKMVCTGAKSEEMAIKAVRTVVQKLREKKIDIKKDAVVAVAYVSADTFELLDTNTVPIFKFSVNTDATNYRIGDIISVYGNAKESVKVSVLDASFNIIWFEEITPDSMDSYSVLVIADGDGWDAGEYTIMASYGADSDTVKITVQ